jgi:hypothetical protein
VQTFGVLAAVLVLIGLALGGRFLYFFIQDPGYSGHTQSLMVGVGAIVLGFVVGLMAMLGDLVAANRRLAEEVLVRIRRVDAALARAPDAAGQIDGVESTAAPPWRRKDES